MTLILYWAASDTALQDTEYRLGGQRCPSELWHSRDACEGGGYLGLPTLPSCPSNPLFPAACAIHAALASSGSLCRGAITVLPAAQQCWKYR